VGADADLVVLDPKAEKVISASAQQSAIDYNVFEGQKVVGLPRFTLTRGRVAYADGQISPAEGHGQFIAREARPAVNRALSQWNQLTAPRPVARTGISATGV
jgi:dihydropyrimidinase